MNNGVLQFSLGLTAGSFLEVMTRGRERMGDFIKEGLKLPGLGVAIGGVIASMTSLEGVVEGVFEAIKQGAELERLSKRTDTTVASLFELQKGFKAVGLSADEVGPMIFRMQKALGGVNEFGEDTRSVFYRVGLDIDALKGKSAPEQFQLIGAAMGKLNSSAAANAASTIFGREGAGNMMELARSTGDFAAAMAEAQKDAATFQRNAESFNRLQVSLDLIKEKTETLFAGMAEGAAPAIQSVIDMVNKIDLSQVGEQVGRIFTIVTEAFKEGSLMELIALSIKSGFEIGFAYLPALLEKLGATLLHLFEQPLIYVQATLTYMELKIMEIIGKVESAVPAVQKALSALGPGGKIAAAGLGALTSGYQDSTVAGMMKGGGAPAFSDVLKDAQNTGVQFGGLSQDSQYGTADIDADANARMSAAKDQMAGILAPLKAFTDGLVARAPKPVGGVVTGAGKKSGDDLSMTKTDYKPQFTDFEKMGFVMGGASNPLLDATKRQTASTDRLTTIMMTMSQKLTAAMMGNAMALNQL